MRTVRTLAERFWDHVQKTDNCWLWTGAKDPDGYGSFYPKTGRCHVQAHRVSYEMAHGSIPRDLLCLHHCDVPHCVRPDHLFLGTQGDNVADKVAKGRQAKGYSHGSKVHPEAVPRGERHGMAKLTGEEVRWIRERYAIGDIGQRALASMCGVSQTQIGHIVTHEQWAHI